MWEIRRHTVILFRQRGHGVSPLLLYMGRPESGVLTELTK